MSSVRTRIIIGVLSVGSGLLAVFGDPLFEKLGAPPRSARFIVMGFLATCGIAFVAWSMWTQRTDTRAAAARRIKKDGDDIG